MAQGPARAAAPISAVPPPGPAPEQPAVLPVAPPARLRRRHWGLLASFLICVVLPLAAISAYLFLVARDQYASTTGFTVRSEEAGGGADLLGGLTALTGAGGGSDAQILAEFITSQDMVRRLDARLSLAAHYAAPHVEDPWFALAPGASIEQLVAHWDRVAHVSFDRAGGLIEVELRAFDPDTAHRIAEGVVAESQILVNALNEQARADGMRFARSDLAAAQNRLDGARATLAAFRSRTQIVDPETDLQGRMGVLATLQEQLAQALIAGDMLAGTTGPDDPRLAQAQARIAVIEARIAQERQTLTQEEFGTGGADYPTLLAEYETLATDLAFAEESYRAALAALDLARAGAERQSRYLAVYIQPTMAEASVHPQRPMLVGLAALFLLLGWSVAVLIVTSIRDRD